MAYEDPSASLPPSPAVISQGAVSVAATLELVASWTELSVTRRRDLASALSTVARLAGMPPGALTLTPGALRQHVLTRSAAACGVKENSMRTVLSALRFVLRRLDLLDRADTPLAPRWVALLNRLDERRRPTMIGFARFCSRRAIGPDQVDSAVLEAFLTQLTERTLTPNPRKQAGSLRMAWNRACARIEGWPGQPLPHLNQAGQFILPLDVFPDSFRQDLDRFGARLAATGLEDPFADRPEEEEEEEAPPLPTRPLRPVTVALRQSHARWAASALVMTGVPIDAVTDLTSLVTPLARAREIIRFLYNRAGHKPSAAGNHVAELLRMVAKYDARLPERDVRQIATWGRTVKLTYKGMTDKNARLVREALDPEHERKLLELPTALMQAARQLLPAAPQQAASLAMRGLAVEMLNKIPLRLGNLIGLRLDQHLQRSDPRRGRINHISVPLPETKNERAIDVPVSVETARFIDEWLRDFRPLVAAAHCVFLFPGHGTGNRSITPQALREGTKKVSKELVGVELSPHKFRHVAAHRFLAAFPGHFEEVRQLLGHATVETTIRHYSGTQHEAAMRRYDEVVLAARRRRPPPDGGASRARRRAGPA